MGSKENVSLGARDLNDEAYPQIWILPATEAPYDPQTFLSP
jgi:hypothetical protein